MSLPPGPADILLPALALVSISLAVWVAMVVIRPRAMIAANVPWQSARHTRDLTGLPGRARDVADNYNHLMEQPTIFYALVFFSFLAGTGDEVNVALAWGYVVLRVVHSLVQILRNSVPERFWIFMWSTLLLIALATRNVFTLTS